LKIAQTASLSQGSDNSGDFKEIRLKKNTLVLDRLPLYKKFWIYFNEVKQ